MKRTIWITIVSVEFAAVLFLGADVYKKHFGLLEAAVSIVPINRQIITFINSGDFKYFYELIPNIHRIDKKVFDSLPESTKKIAGIDGLVNSDGLHARTGFEYAIEKPPGTFRIITVGDSFTFGAYVLDEDNYPGQLEDLLNNKLRCKNISHFEVINLGVAGYDIAYAVERFKRNGQKYNPDLVLWFLKDDDFVGVQEFILSEFKGSLEEARYGMASTDEKLAERWRKAYREMKRRHGYEELIDYSKKYLYEMDNYYKNALLLFSLPFLSSDKKKVIDDFAASRKNTYFYGDLINIYENEENYFPDSHPTAKGYSLIANDLMNYLTTNRIIPCD